MTPGSQQHDAGMTFRTNIRKKLVDMLLDEYTARRNSGDLLYKGRWISPDNKFDFIEEMRKEHKALLHDSLVLLVLGFMGAFFLVLLIKSLFFPA